MKLTKSLFMLCAAGLSLCACNSDEKELFPEGAGIVEVQIVPPTVATRATINALTPNEANSLKVTGTYTVELTANQGSSSKEWTFGQSNVKFENVVGPKKVEVVVNGTIDANGGLAAMTLEQVNTDDMKDATKVPAYGKTTSFTLDAVNKKYTASVQMSIPVARLEVGAIDFVGEEFKKLQVAGVYLDNLRTVGGTYSEANSYFSANATPQIKDYYFNVSETKYGEDTDNAERAEGEKELPYVLGDVVNIDLVSANTSSYYAYNFYGATPNTGTINVENYNDNPQFKICFSAAQLKNEANAIPRYAMITKYKNANNDYIALENGKIYQVTAANLLDANIVDDEDGVAVAYELEVTVQEASWQIVPVTGEWQ